MQPESKPRTPTVVQTLIMLVAISIGVVVYATLCGLMKVSLVHGGFLFLFYWAGIQRADADAFLPSLIGALLGTALAYLVVVLPGRMGPAIGYGIIAFLVLAAIFMMIRQTIPLLINNAFMLYLTVFTLPVAVALKDFWQVGASLLIAAALAYGLMTVGKLMASRRPVSNNTIAGKTHA